MKKIIVHHRSTHHSGYSGYSQLINYINEVEIVSGDSVFSKRLARFIKNRIDQNFGLYDSNSVLKNFELIKRQFFTNENLLIHYLNGERDIRQAINCAPSKVKSIATFHKPGEVLRQTISNPKYLKKLDAAIAVGINQVDFLKEWLNNENVVYIPHGVDTTFFRPDYSKRKENSILFVGQHLRDFEALNFAIPKIKDKIPNIEINIVLRSDFRRKIKPIENIRFFSGIDDNVLREMYQSASILFLPLKNVTACNSILEGMACGLPIVTTDLMGTRGYGLNDLNSVLITPNDYSMLVDEAINSLKNIDKENKKGILLREKSLEFDWKIIANKVEEFYKSFN